MASQKAASTSAEDKRQSASNIGYLGMGLLALVFGIIVIADIPALLRDTLILAQNIKDGVSRLRNIFK